MDSRPIGVFDSGVGGLTVVKEIIDILPNENIVYFGDTARVPYGTKSPDTVTKYSMQNIKFLLTHNIKAIVVACNTASAVSLDFIKDKFDIPIIGVVEPGAKAAAVSTKNKEIGIIGTQGTISSKAYENQVKKLDSTISTYGVACSLFVPLVEEGWFDNEITYKTAEVYLKELKSRKIDTLILGCTHYPLIIEVVRNVMGSEVILINPAHETAKTLYNVLDEKGLSKTEGIGEYQFFLSDIGTKFEGIANNCLNKKIENIQKVDIERY